MNTDNNVKQQQHQPLYGEPQFIEGVAGKKQVTGEPQFVSGKEKHADQLTPIYVEPQHGAVSPYPTGHTGHTGHTGQEQLHGAHNAPGHAGDHSGMGDLTKKAEHLSLSPGQDQHVHLPPDVEHIHIKAGAAPEAGMEKVIRIKPDGRIQVTAERVEEHGTKEHIPHDREKLSSEHKTHSTEHGHVEHKTYTPEHGHSTEHKTHGTEHVHTEHKTHIPEHGHGASIADTLHTQKKRLSDKGHRDTTTETQTVVKVSEHEHGTAGHANEENRGKHDDKLGKGHSDAHHHDTDTRHHDIDTHHHGTDKTKIQVHDNKHASDKHHGTGDTKHHHGTDETKVVVNKHDSDKHHRGTDDTRHHHGTDETKVVVNKHDSDKHHRGTDDTRHHHGTDDTRHHHGTDETKVVVNKDTHHNRGENVTAVKVSDRDHDHDNKRHSDTSTHVRAGTITKPHDDHDKAESQGLLQQLRTTLSESDTPNVDAIGELLIRAETLLHKSANRPNIDPDARKTLEDISTLLITAKQMERHKAIAERLQRISDECQKALSNVKGSDAPTSAMQSASKEAVDFINIWRPVFQLLIRSRDFRQFFVDSLRIAKRVLSRNEGVVGDLTQKFIEGESAQGMKERAKEHRDQNVSVKMSDEEREYLQDEVINVLAVLARNPNYHEAINRVFTLLDMFGSKTKEAIPSSSGHLETHARKAKMETEELVASFTGKDTLKQFKLRLRRLIRSINNDPELKQYSRDVKLFVLSSKSEEEIRSEAFKHRTRELIDRGRYLMDKSKDRDEVEQFIDAANELLDNVKNDEYVKEIRARAGIVRSDLTFTDTEGRTKIDVDMLVKLQTVIIPVLADTFQKIRIPRIEHSDPKLDFWLDNIVLCGYDIFPDNMKFHVERDSDISIRDLDTKGTHTRLVVHLDKLRTEVKNIEFYFKRKSFPSLSDSGLVTVRIPENGAHLAIYFTIEDRAGEHGPRLTEGYADFDIQKLDIEFDKSTLKHDVLIPMVTGLAKPIIRSRIEKAVETNLSNAIKQLGDRLTQVLSELNRTSLFGGMKDTVKSSVPAQVFQERREKLE